MGYTTIINGEFNIEPIPTEEFIDEINLFLEDRHDGDKECPGIWVIWKLKMIELPRVNFR